MSRTAWPRRRRCASLSTRWTRIERLPRHGATLEQHLARCRRSFALLFLSFAISRKRFPFPGFSLPSQIQKFHSPLMLSNPFNADQNDSSW